MLLRRQPRIYEINTWPWLSALGRTSSRAVTLSTVDPACWDTIAADGFDAVWLMGVWQRSPAGIAISNQNSHLIEEFQAVLPDYRPEDNIGSAYCIRRYVVDERLGGPAGLAIARQELARRGIALILDFVPNHVAPDSPSIAEHPEHFMAGSPEELASFPGSFLEIGDRVFACGRDPYFPAWPDTVQVNAFHPTFRQSAIGLLQTIAEQCDGVRCDMAMLMMSDVFKRTWGDRAGPSPPTEYWPEVIGLVRHTYPDFVFIAEAYWDLEWQLQQQGFDYCYDKRLYDRLVAKQAGNVRLHLQADCSFQQKLLRFIENHDEPRSAAVFSLAVDKVAALTMATIPGAKLFYEGQLEGIRSKIPVFLGRGPDEPVLPERKEFYSKLLEIIQAPVFREGEWLLCRCTAPDGVSDQEEIAAWCWKYQAERRLVIVNLGENNISGNVSIPWNDFFEKRWAIRDLLSQAEIRSDNISPSQSVLFVEMTPWEARVLRLTSSE